MYITNVTQNYIVFSEDRLVDVLKKINDNKSRIVFVVSEHAVLLGSISDGDVRRWLINEKSLNLEAPAAQIMNADCKKVSLEDNHATYSNLFRNGVDCLPVVDDYGHLVKLVFQGTEGFFIGSREISDKAPIFVIAEIGNNHQGDLALAKQLIDHAADAGADCAKFQMRNVGKLYKNEGNTEDASADLGAQYTMDLLSRFQLSNEQLFEAFDHCKARGLIPMCTPWDIDSLNQLESYGMDAYKVASADFTNYELLEAVSRTGKPFICSTGMSSENEIKSTVDFLNGLGAEYVLLHCNSTYPTPYKDVNLGYLSRMKKFTGRLVGYSGHERGYSVPLAAAALGACIIEKHITVDRSLEGTDHKVSLLPEELTAMVTQLRNVETALGTDEKPREITQGELINRENLAKSLVAAVDIPKGTKLTRSMITIKSPGQGMQPNRLKELLGKVAKRDMKVGDYFYVSDIEGGVQKRANYAFSRPFGVPVRYHDFRGIVKETNLDFVEFHLSYKDMEINLDDYFSGEEEIGFAVHSPELFAGDHILDLCSEDPAYREHSIAELTRVVEITRRLKAFFPKTATPAIVVNAGGWKKNGFIEASEKPAKYAAIGEALRRIDLNGVQIAIQTMPPFPWHFGGQSYHNLFVSAEEIKEFCDANPDIKICFDVSHSMMACNYYGWDLMAFTETICPYIAHMHVVDAKGVDGEGVEIGGGDVDFTALSKLLNDQAPDTQFIPEVWQGHKNGGEGFWKALDFLEPYMK